MELNRALDLVRKLVAKAESTDSAHEAEALQEQADAIMQKYLIEEWQLEGSAPRGLKPTKIKVDIGAGDSPLLQETAMLVSIIADFCKCQSVWYENSGWKMRERQEYCWVYGYESDLAYFELLFTTLYLHMSGAMFPKPDSSLSVGENVRNYRKAGYNWNQIAGEFGWDIVDRNPKAMMFRHRETGEVAVWGKVVRPLKVAYAKHIKATGEAPVSLGRGGAGNLSFRLSAARGYLARISQRLREAQAKRGVGTELVLADKSQNIAALVADENPELAAAKSRSIRYNPDAYRRGVRHAETANLQPGRGEAGKGSSPAIGA